MNLADFAWSKRYFTQQTTSLVPAIKSTLAAIFIHFPTTCIGKQTEDKAPLSKTEDRLTDPFSSTVNEARRFEAPPTFNSLQLASTVTKVLAELKTPKKRSKILSSKPLFNVHYAATVRSFCHCRFVMSVQERVALYWVRKTLNRTLLRCRDIGWRTFGLCIIWGERQ